MFENKLKNYYTNCIKAIEENKLYQYLFLLVIIVVMMNFYHSSYWLRLGSGDFDLTYFTLEVAKKSFHNYNQIPLWNPWSIGGINFLANPQTMHYGFLYFPIYFLKTPIAVKIIIILYFYLGICGMYSLLRIKNISIWVSLWGATIFSCTSYFTWHVLAAGHMNTLSILLTPWLLYTYENYIKSKKLAFINFLIPILIYYNLIVSGASYALIYTPIFIFLYVLSICLQEKRNYKVLTYIAFTILFGYGLSFWKLLPSLHYISDVPREYHDTTRIGLFQLLQVFTDHAPNKLNDSFTYHGWWEYGAYFEIIGLLLLFYFRKSIQLSYYTIGFASLILWFSMGNIPNHVNPWNLLNSYVPIFNNLRAPTRAIIYVILLFCIWLPEVIDKNRKQHPILKLIMISWLISLWATNFAITTVFSESEKIKYITNNNEYTLLKYTDSVIHNSPGIMYNHIQQNISILNGYEPLPSKNFGFTKFNHDKKYQLIEDSTARIVSFSPNEIEILVDSNTKSLLINQNYDQGWKIVEGKGDLINDYGLIKIINPSSNIKLKFEPAYYQIGLRLSIVFAVIIFSIIIMIEMKKNILPIH